MKSGSLRRLLAAAAIGLTASAPPAAADDEAAVREALQRCVAGWNAHEPKVFGDCLSADVWFSEADDSFYKRLVGRDKVLGMFDYNIRNSDLQWEVVHIRPLADGSVAVQLKQRVGILPLTDGKYAMAFDSDPSLARLRREDGAWKLHFFTSDPRWARALLQELDAPKAAAAPSVAPPATMPKTAVAPGDEPPNTPCPSATGHRAACIATAGHRR